MAKIVAFNDESRRALERGVNALADAVRTLGKGRNVLWKEIWHQIVNDGITVAKEIELEDPGNTGARLIQEVASNQRCGWGWYYYGNCPGSGDDSGGRRTWQLGQTQSACGGD